MFPNTPALAFIDWAIIVLYLVFALAIGLWFSSKAGESVESFFAGNRQLPWWIAGTSMVATTFAADTPLAVAGLVATGGIAGNWLWWSWAIAHIVATFFFAKLWRRSEVLTDAEITELRYGGKTAAALRAFKAVYFGIFINCMTMAWVIKAMAKISSAFFEVQPIIVIGGCIVFSVAYTIMGGLRSVVVTDFVQFALGMMGALALGILAADNFGGIGQLESVTEAGSGLLGALQTTSTHFGRDVHEVLAFMPDSHNSLTPLAFLVVMLFAGWWRYAEGSGYIVQRLAACRSEAHAQGASLWFAVAHNALRPWPWIIVGLAALVVYPQLPGHSSTVLQDPSGLIEVEPGSIDVAAGGQLKIRVPEILEETLIPKEATLMGHTVTLERVETTDAQGSHILLAAFPAFETSAITTLTLHSATTEYTFDGMRVELLDREMGYPLLMRKYLPAGLLGMVIASLLAAFMSTIDTHTNWGASYVVRDIYERFVNKEATPQQAVLVSRLAIVAIALIAGLTATQIDSIAGVWHFLITLGSGLGSVTAARWYWHRVTPHAEFAAIFVTTISALLLLYLPQLEPVFALHHIAIPAGFFKWAPILIVAGLSLLTWIPVSLWGPQNDITQLQAFYTKVQPPGPGWRKVAAHVAESSENPISTESLMPLVLLTFVGIAVVFSALYGIGEMLLGTFGVGAAICGAAALAGVWLALQSGTKDQVQ